MDNNPFETRMIDQLDRRRDRPPRPASHRTATSDPRHLVPRKEVPVLFPRKETTVPTLQAKSLKVTLVLQAEEIASLSVPEGRIVLSIRLPDRTVKVDLASKSIRKAQAAIREHGPDGVACVLQGRLVSQATDDVLAEAGLSAQVKAKPVAA